MATQSPAQRHRAGALASHEFVGWCARSRPLERIGDKGVTVVLAAPRDESPRYGQLSRWQCDGAGHYVHGAEPCPYPVQVLVIREDLVDEVIAHARRDHPDEACGVIAGPVGTDRPERFIAMVNAARSPTFYEFESGDLLRLYREMDANDEVPVVIYHSHTATEAYPSRTDVAYASEPEAHYVLVSTREGQPERRPEFRSFRIVDGEITEEPVEVVETYMFSHTGADDVPDGR